MSIVKTEAPYEYLIRIHEDGTIGAHKRIITRISQDGEVLTTYDSGAESINFDELKEYVGSITRDMWYVPPVPAPAPSPESGEAISDDLE